MIKVLTATVFSVLAFPSVWAGVAGGTDSVGVEVSVSETNDASVSAVYAGESADVILLNAGYENDFCAGARCRVGRDDAFVAEIIIVDAKQNQSAALITFLENNQTIQTGDTVKLKTI